MTGSPAPALDYAEPVADGFDDTAQFAAEVLRDVLGDFYSAEDERRETAAWELQNGQALKMGCETWPDYHARAKKFGPVPYHKVDIQTAREELDRLSKVNLLELDDESRERVQGLIHGYEERLSLPKTDFSKAKKETAGDGDAAALARFEKITRQNVYTDRLKAVAAETDIATLNLVSTRDTHAAVREAATKRILTLTIRK